MTGDIDGIGPKSVTLEDRPVPPAPPRTGEDSADVLDEATFTLTMDRFPGSWGDAAAKLHALASLIADAIDQDHRWQDIAICLGITPSAARRRYAGYVRSRPVAPFED